LDKILLNNKRTKKILITIIYLVLSLIVLAACFPKQPVEFIPITSLQVGEHEVYLPTILNGSGKSTPYPSGNPLIHVPYKNVSDYVEDSIIEMAIFWLGEVTINENYADVRIGYNDENLFVYTAIFDRLLWYDTSPAVSQFLDWDSVSLFILPDNQEQLVTNNTYRFVAQLAAQDKNRQQYQAAFRWGGSSWLEQQNLDFQSVSGWRGEGGLNTPNDNRGWTLKFVIPFSSLGFQTKPSEDTIWKMGIVVHDRDYFDPRNIPDQQWPQNFIETNPSQWGNLSFGALPSMQMSDIGTAEDTSLLLREGINGVIVPDTSVGGNSTCAEGINFWTEWGAKTYSNPPENMTLVIQNQRDIADWPCYSKYFVQFPIDSIPDDAKINHATLTLHQFGNSGTEGDAVFQPYRSIIQVFLTDSNWEENSITWNNAPQILENVASKQVDPLVEFPNWPGVRHDWDLTYAVQQAKLAGQDTISLALYSADGAYHSGKYFSTSEVPDWNIAARPALSILYSAP
jgi:hypothetical protein